MDEGHQWARVLAYVKSLGRKGLEKFATVARPENILGWFRSSSLTNLMARTITRIPGESCQPGNRESDRSPRSRELQLGMRPHRW
jgi:hypothetical protein